MELRYMKTLYQAFSIKPNVLKKGYYSVHPLTFKYNKLLRRKALCTWSWDEVYRKLRVTEKDIPLNEVPIIIRKDIA